MNVKDQYKSKLISIQEALSKFKSGDEIVAAFCATQPFTILSGLHHIADKVEDLTVWVSLGLADYPFLDPKYRKTIEVNSWFLSPITRKRAGGGNISYQPSHLHDGALRKIAVKPPTVFIGQCTPVDKHGYVNLSLSLLYEKAFIENAERVILEVNPNLPYVHGDTQLHISEVDWFVESKAPLAILPKGTTLTEKDQTIGEYVASLVNDGDTIQLGIGQIPDAVARNFMDKKDLGVHTEMITSSLVDLVEAGVITGRRKTINKGKIVGTFAFGDERLYEFLDNNPSVAIMRGDYVNHPYVIAQNDNMVSINTALQVDLTGQISSESIGTQMVSGTGGQSDTAVGAIHSKNGKSIIALHSTALGGKESSIRPTLYEGAVVSMQRNNIDYVVTEYGIALMKAQTIKQRTHNLIAVAHPDFRDELREEAKKHGFI